MRVGDSDTLSLVFFLETVGRVAMGTVLFLLLVYLLPFKERTKGE